MIANVITVQIPSKDRLRVHQVNCVYSEYTKTYIGSTDRDKELMFDYGCIHFMLIPVDKKDPEPTEFSKEWVCWAGQDYKILTHHDYAEELPA